MPHPSRLSSATVLAEARALLEDGGQDALTMRELARRLGVRAPSLYLYVESRNDLLRQLIRLGLEEFGHSQALAIDLAVPPREQAFALARAYIAFAEENPQLFALTFGPCPEEVRVDAHEALAASDPVLRLAAALAGPDLALPAAESLWAYVHGYTILRLARQFLLNPDHEAGFEFGLRVLVDGMARPVPAAL